MTFPHDRYTPHGYLHLARHARRLRPLGVVRSWDRGFRWHVPAFEGGYGGRRVTYRAGVRVAIDGSMDIAEPPTSSPYHTGNVMVMEAGETDPQVRLTWHLVGDHAVRCIAEHLTTTARNRSALHVSYERLMGASGEWGESGLVGRSHDGLVVLQSFEDGEAVVLWTSETPTDLGVTSDETIARRWTADAAPGNPSDGYVTVLGRRDELVELHAVVGLPALPRQEWILCRGRTLAEAQRHLDVARGEADAAHRRSLESDHRFWAGAPRLSGDWPDHWRRGMVYDLETIRMMVRPPLGIYQHAWDGMQIQAPRVVLAESAMDALVLAWADPALAQELLLGTFLDAPEENVPGTREDGSYNMVAADGTVCGTAPAWGHPVWVAAQLFAMAPDPAWLARIQAPLASYLRWWLEHRRDDAGYLVYACSWESGQDLSPRFGDQPLGGGHPARHLRPVDLHAAMTQACLIMARFAELLGRDAEAVEWSEQAGDLQARTAVLWDGSRWADVDGRSGRPTTTDDVMLATPLALGVAGEAQAQVVADGRWLDSLADPSVLAWPMFLWTAAEALRAIGRSDRAADVLHAVLDRVYLRWDAPVADPARALPGISAEYWPVTGGGGGEGYGWGAFGVHLALSSLVGLRFEDGPELRPCLPTAWRVAGRSYDVTLVVRGRRRTIAIRPLGPREVDVDVDGQVHRVRWGDGVRLDPNRDES